MIGSVFLAFLLVIDRLAAFAVSFVSIKIQSINLPAFGRT